METIKKIIEKLIVAIAFSNKFYKENKGLIEATINNVEIGIKETIRLIKELSDIWKAE